LDLKTSGFVSDLAKLLRDRQTVGRLSSHGGTVETDKKSMFETNGRQVIFNTKTNRVDMAPMLSKMSVNHLSKTVAN